MNTAFYDMTHSGVDAVTKAAADDWRVSAGMIAAGCILGLFEGVRRWRKRKKQSSIPAQS